ncbi:MAG TPA: hypothetical protein VGO62_18350 [Myxococcota bacterium]|jgi:hypothetical protein
MMITLAVGLAALLAPPDLAPPTPAPVAAPAPSSHAPKRIAVMKTEVTGAVDAALGPQITAKLAEEVRAQTHAEVISSDEIVALLKHEKERAILGECKEQESCLAELANALGAEVVVSAKLSSVAGKDGATSYALSVSAVDASSAAVVGRDNESWGGDALGLLQLCRPVVTKVFATNSIPKGALEVVGAVGGSKILVDDEVRGSSELPHVDGLLVGAHHVVVENPDKKPVDKWIIVEADKQASLAVSQESMSDPFYTTWWFWTGTGVVVAGGVAAGVAAIALQPSAGKTGVAVQLNADKALGGAP